MTRVLDTHTRKPRKRRSIILIGLEGKNQTEKNYFKNYKSTNYTISFPTDEYTDPVGIINKLNNYAKQKEIDINEDNNKIYCIFDTDTDKIKNKQIKEAMKIAKKNGIEIILSNPCFEDWFLCHFKYSTRELNNKEIIKELNKFIKPILNTEYEKNIDIYNILKDKTDIAINNAKKQCKHQNNLKKDLYSVEANPSTMVYNIVEDLINRDKEK